MSRLAVTEERFRRIAYAALAALSVIVLTGALVRLTNSGLGCPTWPRCYGHVYPPVALHPLIEFGNRALSGVVGVVTVMAFVAACLRRPFRREFAWIAAALPGGVVAQAVLGGFTVREKLAPGFVMGHFLLSMVILIFAFWLAWRATYPRGVRPRTTDRLLVWSVRSLFVLCTVTVFAGTAATAAGPHSGGNLGQHIKRLTIEGPNTLEWAVHQHATIAAVFGIATILVWLLKRQRQGGPLDPLEPLTVLGILLAAQGLVGSVQYELKLPGEMVWVHIVLATATWLVTLWAVAVTGRIGAPAAADAEDPIATIVAEWSRSVPAS